MLLLDQKFYFKPAKILAQDLLGQYIVRKMKEGELIGKIVETEAYLGFKDKAAHSYKGRRTQRNEILYGEGGFVYIYLIYGMYWQFNITGGKKNNPECVLVRALEPIKVRAGEESKKEKLANGPGKLTRWLSLDKSFYGQPLFKKGNLWLGKGEKIKSTQIVSSRRIGIDYAQDWAYKKLRFYIRDNLFVSKK